MVGWILHPRPASNVTIGRWVSYSGFTSSDCCCPPLVVWFASRGSFSGFSFNRFILHRYTLFTRHNYCVDKYNTIASLGAICRKHMLIFHQALLPILPHMKHYYIFCNINKTKHSIALLFSDKLLFISLKIYHLKLPRIPLTLFRAYFRYSKNYIKTLYIESSLTLKNVSQATIKIYRTA